MRSDDGAASFLAPSLSLAPAVHFLSPPLRNRNYLRRQIRRDGSVVARCSSRGATATSTRFGLRSCRRTKLTHLRLRGDDNDCVADRKREALFRDTFRTKKPILPIKRSISSHAAIVPNSTRSSRIMWTKLQTCDVNVNRSYVNRSVGVIDKSSMLAKRVIKRALRIKGLSSNSLKDYGD